MPEMQERFTEIETACKRHAPHLSARPHSLLACIDTQSMGWFRDGALAEVFRISTSRKPPSCRENSLGTPTGLHHIAARIGEGEPPGTVFKGRVPVAPHWEHLPPQEQENNLITTRILRLRGNENKNNGPGRDSFDRYIYIHGTNQEDKIGQPNSHGCILMLNDDIVRLFAALPVGTPVLILPA